MNGVIYMQNTKYIAQLNSEIEEGCDISELNVNLCRHIYMYICASSSANIHAWENVVLIL